MKHVLVICDEDAFSSPRPSRLIRILSELNAKISLIHTGSSDCAFISQSIEVFTFDPLKRRDFRDKFENDRIYHMLMDKRYTEFFLTPNRDAVFELAKNIRNVDLIVLENIALLIHAVEIKGITGAKLCIDLREFYPLEYSDDEWVRTVGAAFNFLCEKYLRECDVCFSVNESLASKYMSEYGVQCGYLLSLPPFHNLKPNKVEGSARVLYHGYISPDRDSLNLLEIFDSIDGFSLDVLAVSNFVDYLNKFKECASSCKNVRVLDKIDISELVEFGNRYDIGVLTLMDNSFNNMHALPNKFFEYIQSRLCVIATPTKEIEKYIKMLGVGYLSSSFSSSSVKKLLLSLDNHSIMAAKRHSNFHALNYSMESNKQRVHDMLFGHLNCRV